MAEGKKSFVVYSDWKGMFEKLPDDVAGKLIKHIFAYVNDEDPETDDYIISALFEQIKATLKRDLKKWEDQLEQRSIAGKASAEKRRLAKEQSEKNDSNDRSTKSNDRSIPFNETQRNSTVSVNVNDNCNMEELSIYNYNNSLMSEIEISNVPQNEIEFFTIGKSFFDLFMKNSNEVLKVKWSHLGKLKYKDCISPIRLLLTTDSRTKEDLQKVYKLLQSDDFWMRNIQSTKKLREKFDQLITKTSETKILNNGTKQPIRTQADKRREFLERSARYQNGETSQ